MTRFFWARDFLASLVNILHDKFLFTIFLPCADLEQQLHQYAFSTVIHGKIIFDQQCMWRKDGLGNRFTENWVIKFLRRSHGKLLICFQTNFFAFPRTWLPSYVSLEEGHVFNFFNLSFSMQIKSFPWGLI